MEENAAASTGLVAMVASVATVWVWVGHVTSVLMLQCVQTTREALIWTTDWTWGMQLWMLSESYISLCIWCLCQQSRLRVLQEASQRQMYLAMYVVMLLRVRST